MKYVNYLFVFAFAFFSTATFAQAQNLPLNSEEFHEFGSQGLLLNFQAQEQGVLAIAIESIEIENERPLDISIILYDPYNQEIEQIDVDHAGKLHNERGFFIIPNAGEYTIKIARTLLGGLASFIDEQANSGNSLFEDNSNDSEITQKIHIAASFIPTTVFTSFLPEDKDGDNNPLNAISLPSNTEESMSASVGGENDTWDWWKIEGEFNIVIVTASTEDGNIMLRVYDPNKMEGDWLEEDQVITGEENLVFRPENPGDTVVLKITPFHFSDPNEEVHYTIKVEAY